MAQGLEFRQAQLHRVVPKGIAHPPVDLGLLPSQCVRAEHGTAQAQTHARRGARVSIIGLEIFFHHNMIELLSLPAFTDNYIWMVHNGREAVVVDPGESSVVRQTLEARRLTLTAILVTHHHPGHTGGIDGLRDLLQGPVYAPAREQTPEPRMPVGGGQQLRILGQTVQVLDVPGHTAGHIAYVMSPQGEDPILFCGDTLFSGGCGRLFEGTAEQMHASLSRLASLPSHTRVCCAHEYTLSNLRFARRVEPGNAELQIYAQSCEALRASGRPTLPSRIEIEQRINPFLRCEVPEVRQSALAQGAAGDDPVAVLATLREWKNRS